MAISKTKKRYYVTLTPGRVERFQDLCKQLHLPPSTMSNALDDMLDSISDTFQTALDKGSLELSDLFKVMGNQMEQLEADEKERKTVNRKEMKNVPEQKRRTVRNSKKAV